MLVVLPAAASAMLAVATRDPWPSNDGLTIYVFALFAATGLVIGAKQPGNLVGRLFVATAFLALLDTCVRSYLVLDYREHGGTLPLGTVAASLRVGLAILPFLVGLPTILLFPDGRVSSRRWRRVLRAYVVLGGVFSVLQLAGAVVVIIGQHPVVNIRGDVPALNPGRIAGDAWIISPLFLICWLAFVGHQVASWRRSSGERRAQLKWLMGGGTVCVVSSVLLVLEGNGSSLGSRLAADVAILGIGAMPIAIGVGILKYRLYEIDRLISRTLSYAIVTGTLVAVFVGLIALITGVLPFSSPLAVAASTLVVAALFNPVRGRVQHIVDRRFNRARYDAEAIVEALSRRLREAVDLDSVHEGLRDAIGTAVEPSHLTVWIRSAS